MPRRMRGGPPFNGYNYTPFPPVYNADEGEEEIDPRAYYASVDQIWYGFSSQSDEYLGQTRLTYTGIRTLSIIG